ncbi:MAG TPA: hypothetical protein VKE74_13855 [Gemmataceae bacterium]|nr:hypothetical protein [Gemmataceae bacterium]
MFFQIDEEWVNFERVFRVVRFNSSQDKYTGRVTVHVYYDPNAPHLTLTLNAAEYEDLKQRLAARKL